jgi:hypothetical protein
MSVPERTTDSLTQEAIDILLSVKEQIRDGSDFMWTSFEDATELRAEIDRCINGIKARDRKVLDVAHTHFQPAFDFQEHSLQNGWSDLYTNLAGRFDKVHEQLKSLLKP